MKTTSLKDYVQKQLDNPDFRKEYEALEEEFTIAQEVIALRLEAHMTQKELAERVGTSQPAIARLESGNYKNLSLAFLRRVARALGTVTEVHLKKQGT